MGEKWKKGIPIEVIPMSRRPIQQKIESKYGGEAILRMSADKAVSRQQKILINLYVLNYCCKLNVQF